ncbi:MAG: bifunctional 4-hydroxy-2-oxoglutarate aldolase/2-dehydro-3-deoxy-phosphogluconate aldolase [Cyclobacteriaceae bacterium]|jgi:2-dehydro-3-deoxyphosphogluconate aldolase/(4S)-4-hydroxy-2-oxoglutarate aldolase|nr:bifunctional 4-hydroxy-2-oxoglutarate aldolase/2-dehydro-3-deoxy-phosphogluconate aldolase [Cyclobacteriaceae bacterium]
MNHHLHQIAQQLAANRVVPVFYHADEKVCLHVLEACYEGGLRVFEFTNRGEAALPNFRALRKKIQTDFTGMMLGAGTLYNNPTAHTFIQEGADFIVSPALVPEMQTLQTNHYTLWIPGCATVSELAHARALGVLLMKVFPGDLLGPAFVSAALSVMPGLRLMPTGGVSPTRENVQAWFRAGVACVGMGSQLVTQELVAKQDWKQLAQRVRDTLAITHELSRA